MYTLKNRHNWNDGKDRFYLYEDEETGDTIKYYSHDCLQYSDYGGSYTLGKANCLAIERDYPEFHTEFEDEYERSQDMPEIVIHYTGYNGKIGFIREDIWEGDYDSLEDYPVLDDEILSEIEEEIKQEYLEMWFRYDLRFDDDEFDEIWDTLSDDKKWEYIYQTIENQEIYGEIECMTAYFPGLNDSEFIDEIMELVLFDKNPENFEGTEKYRDFLEENGQERLFSNYDWRSAV